MFMRREPGQSWADALEAADDYHDFGAGPDADVWQRVAGRARFLLGEVASRMTDDSGELNHERTGLRLLLFADSAELTVPADDTALLRTMFLLGQVVEEETGLEGYDPRMGKPIREAAANLDLGAASFESVARILSNPS